MEGKDAQMQEGVKLAGSRSDRHRTDSLQDSEVSLGKEIRNILSCCLVDHPGPHRSPLSSRAGLGHGSRAGLT